MPYYITQGYLGNGEEIFFKKEIVLLFKDSNSAQQDSIANLFGLRLLKSEPSVYNLYEVTGDPLSISRSIFETGLVRYCHPNFYITARPTAYTPNDPHFAKQWYLHNTGQLTNDGHYGTPDADINAPEAWEITKGCNSTTVAVIDNGITFDHRDLEASRVVSVPGRNFAYDYDGTGDPNNSNPTPYSVLPSPNLGHGNACAGIIGATFDNGVGVTGIAPFCKIMPIKVPLEVPAPSIRFADAITLAHKYNANVISMTWTSTIAIPSVQVAIENVAHLATITIAAGNTAHRAIGGTGIIQFPGWYDNEYIITVGASDRNNKVAEYSPDGNRLEIVAPSHTAYSEQIPTEAENIWALDNPGFGEGANSWKDAATTLPLLGEQLPSTGFFSDHFTGRFGGTSAATPQVAAVAALMLCVHPCMSPAQIRDILLSTADKIGPYNYEYYDNEDYLKKWPGYSIQTGYGKLNAFRAVQAADLLYKRRSNKDQIYTKDNISDVGLVGVNGTGGGDKSPDIWVRNTDDGEKHQVHQNPEFTAGGKCYVYVRVRNNYCDRYYSTSGAKLSLYWSKASTWSSWPKNWNGTSPSTGNLIGTQTIPMIPKGESVILKFEWTLLDPYANKTWNSCLLSRIEMHPTDVITVYPDRLDKDVLENNNVSIRNVTIVDNVPGFHKPLGGTVLVGNASANPRNFNIKLLVPPTNAEPKAVVTTDAEVRMKFDSLGWFILQSSNQLNQQSILVLPNREIILKSDSVVLSNITFPADTRIPIDVSFNFLTDAYNSKAKYAYSVSQTFTDTPDLILGTEHYEINKNTRTPFQANAGADSTINLGDSITLCAAAISENASYKWFDLSGNFIDSGRQIVVLPNLSTTYKLEVIADLDGFKDYDEVSITVRKYFLTSVTPNPSSTQVTIGYQCLTASNASLSFCLPNGTVYATYAINPQNNSANIDISQFPSAIYTLSLICDGQLTDSRLLQKN